MKKIRLKTYVLNTLLLSTLLMTSCGSINEKQKVEKEHIHNETYENMKEGHHGTMDHEPSESMTHSCPMHSDEKGMSGDECSQCGMLMEPIQDNHDSEGHNH